ncbi:MAG: Uma2 family endonuclease [Cyanobacteria bacterium J06642_2]
MVAIAPTQTDIFYPSGDGEPVAETFAHFYAILAIFEVLSQYLQGRQATVLANQFLYYAPGFPKLRVAPDIMVIFGVKPGGRDNFKAWEEGEVPAVVFEVTSAGTRQKDFEEKKTLYENLGVSEYWLFDPRGEWIEEKLRGFRLCEETYKLISEDRSKPLNLRLVVEGELLTFYREDTGQKLLLPAELAAALQQTELQRQQEAEARQQAELQRQQEAEARQQGELQRQRETEARRAAEALVDRYRAKFGDLDD